MSASTALPCAASRLRVDLADDRLRPRLVHARIEHELAAVLRIGRRRNDGPAGQHLGEAGHVVLGVDRAHAERMQLEDLAREVLVQPARVDEAGDRFRPDRARIVEIEQHRRMARRRRAACRRNGRAHAGGSPRARSRPPCSASRRPRCRNGSTRTRPAARRTRSPARSRRRGAPSPRGRRSAAGSASAAGHRRVRLRFHAFPWTRPPCARSSAACFCAIRRACRSWRKLNAAVEDCARGHQLGIDDLADAGLVEFGKQRAARIGRDRGDRAGARAEAEAMQRQRGRTFRIERHGRGPQRPPRPGIDRTGGSDAQGGEYYRNFRVR